MEMLTIAIVAVVLVLLLAGLVVGRRFISRAGESSQFPQRQNDIRPRIAPTGAPRPASVPAAAKTRVAEVTTTIATLEVKLLNRLAGNRGAMDRTIELYRSKFPHLTEIELREKILYDLERGH